LTSVAVYGGSFDPPHVAHVLSAAYALSVGGFDKVLVVPVFEHPFGKALAPFSDRLALCHAAFEGQSRVEVSAVEAELERPSYTERTLERLSHDHPDWRLRVLVGSDVLADTSAWHDFAEVERRAPPFVLTRRGFERPDAGPALLPEVSSTRVRELLRKRADEGAVKELRFLVPVRVLAEIEARGLYVQSRPSVVSP
jgi:nicotinate-nucleotide adenylyltransferase